jgi:hypothetical protein
MDIIQLLKKELPDCQIQQQDNLIYVFKEGNATHYDYNYLNYLFESGQLTEQNIKFMLLLINKLP